VEWQKWGMVEKFERGAVLLDLFPLFHNSFPPTTAAQKSRSGTIFKKEQNEGAQVARECVLRHFLRFFSTLQKASKPWQTRHISHF